MINVNCVYVGATFCVNFGIDSSAHCVNKARKRKDGKIASVLTYLFFSRAPDQTGRQLIHVQPLSRPNDSSFSLYRINCIILTHTRANCCSLWLWISLCHVWKPNLNESRFECIEKPNRNEIKEKREKRRNTKFVISWPSTVEIIITFLLICNDSALWCVRSKWAICNAKRNEINRKKRTKTGYGDGVSVCACVRFVCASLVNHTNFIITLNNFRARNEEKIVERRERVREKESVFLAHRRHFLLHELRCCCGCWAPTLFSPIRELTFRLCVFNDI